jgi:predicted O-linked N-acetylglucosamine transferase (SPINDLY family)
MARKPPSPQSGPAFAQTIQQAMGLHRQGRLPEAETLYASVLAQRPDHFEASYLLGMLRMQQGRPARALPLVEAAAAIKPYSPEALASLAAVLAALNRHAEALAKYDRLLKVRPGDVDAHYNRGVVLSGLGRHAEALTGYERTLAIRPDHVPALFNRANTLALLGRYDTARAAYDALLAIAPNNVEALNNRGNALGRLGRAAEALASYDKALALDPNHVNALNNRGNALKELTRHEEALAMYDRALAVDPGNAASLGNRGNALIELDRSADAIASFDRALALAPQDPELLFNRACALERLGRFDQALAGYDQSLAIRPDNANALHNRGNVLVALKRPDDAIASYGRALAIAPDRADTLNNRGNELMQLGRREAAIADYERAVALDPRHPHAFDSLAFSQLSACNWTEAARLAAVAEAAIATGNLNIGPTYPIYYFGNPAYQLSCARDYLRRDLAPIRVPLSRRAAQSSDKLRIAYLSSDFRTHAVGAAIAELLERHDRTRFEIIGVSYGRDDASALRARIVRAFDRFHDAGRDGDRDVAALLNQLDVHIAVDLNGLTRGGRPGVLAYRPAPVQVAYLGYAGTTGAAFIDYVLADATVLPFDQQPFFTEKIVHLPDCYHLSDTTRSVAPDVPVRSRLGLPATAPVFCCFNQSYKITAAVFEVWTRLLARIDGSVLWLSPMNALATANLRREAAARGVDPDRLVFAPHVERIEDHLARHRRADVFLDTLPYGAHSTAIDALWAGLPVVTCAGAAFAGRVGTSLVGALGLPELATASLADYEALAFRLATDASLLQSVRGRLERNRATHPLFDGDRSRRHIEAAYATMWDIHQRGESPRSFGVERIVQ